MIEKLISGLKGEEIPVPSEEYKKLVNELRNIKTEISDLNTVINFTTDPILLNQLIFQLKAAEMRYRYWFNTARNFNAGIDNHE